MKKKLVLASGSPRRKEILSQAGFSFRVLPVDADESLENCNPEEMVQILAGRKAAACMELLKKTEGNADNLLVLGADTVVVYDNTILGKPVDREDAADTLRNLQGKCHSVYTGFSLIWLDDQNQIQNAVSAEKTSVHFYPMSEEEIHFYVNTGECDDKAGSYAIQGIGMRYIEKIEGDYHNVVGLPLGRLYQTLKSNHLEIEEFAYDENR